MRHIFTCIALAMQLGIVAPSWAFQEPVAVKTASCGSRLAALGRWKVPRWLSTLVIAGVILPPVVDESVKHSLHHDIVSFVTRDPHLGAGIYFNDHDWARVVESLSPSSQEILRYGNRRAIATLLANEVSGDYDDTRIPKSELTAEDIRDGIRARHYTDFPGGVRGSHFVTAKGQPRGNCDHKAVVLAELLRRSGVPAHVEKAMLKEEVAHAYVVFRLEDGAEWIADPTNFEVSPAGDYRNRHVAYEIDYFGRPSRPPAK